MFDRDFAAYVLVLDGLDPTSEHLHHRLSIFVHKATGLYSPVYTAIIVENEKVLTY